MVGKLAFFLLRKLKTACCLPVMLIGICSGVGHLSWYLCSLELQFLGSSRPAGYINKSLHYSGHHADLV